MAYWISTKITDNSLWTHDLYMRLPWAIHGLQSRVVFKKPEVFKVRRKETKFPKPFQELWMFMAKSTKPLPFPWGDEGDSQDD